LPEYWKPFEEGLKEKINMVDKDGDKQMSLNFSFSEEQELYRRRIRQFGENVLAQQREEWDRQRKTPWPLIRQAAEEGLLDPHTDFVTRGILVEEVGYFDFNCALPFLLATLPYELYKLPGIPVEVKQPLIEDITKGKKIMAVCFTEPVGGSDMAAFKGRAVKKGDYWCINATKNSISWADADAYLVAVPTEGGQAGVWGLTNFFVPKDTPGVNPPDIWDDLGSRGVKRGVVHFEDVYIPANYLVGEIYKGYPMIAEFFDTNRAYIGLKCIGAAQASVDEACGYAKERMVMGKTISHYQSISFPLAEADTLLEAARLLCYKTLWMADRGIRHTKEGSMCKWWVPEITFEIVRKCLTIHGHYGYTSDLPLEQRLRDIIGWQIGDGTAEVSKLLIARHLMGKKFVD